MARRLAIPSKALQLLIVGPRDFFKASRVQKLSLTTDVPTEDKDELGNRLHIGQTKDTPTATLTFSAFDAGIKIFAALTGSNSAAYPASGVDISNLGQIDAVLNVKDDVVEDYVKSISGRKLQVSNFAFNYTVDGDSTEDYTAVGSERRYLKYDVQVDKLTVGTTSFTLTQTPVQLKNGRYAISVILDGNYLDEVAVAPATGQYRIVGTTLTTFDSRVNQILIVYHAQLGGLNWTDVSDLAIPIAIRGKDVKVTIAANNIPRIQSVTVNGNLNQTPVKELGNRVIVGYQKQVPTIDGTIAVLDTDTDLVSLLTNGAVGSGIEWMPGETACITSGLALKVFLYDPCDANQATIVKTVYIPSITIVGDAFASNVNNNATQNFNFRSVDAQCIVYSGSH